MTRKGPPGFQEEVVEEVRRLMGGKGVTQGTDESALPMGLESVPRNKAAVSAPHTEGRKRREAQMSFGSKSRRPAHHPGHPDADANQSDSTGMNCSFSMGKAPS